MSTRILEYLEIPHENVQVNVPAFMAKLEEQLQIQYKFIQNRIQQVNAVIPLSFACANPNFPPPLTPSIPLHSPTPDIHPICTRSTNPIDAAHISISNHSPAPVLFSSPTPTFLMMLHLRLILLIVDSEQYLLFILPLLQILISLMIGI